MQDALMVIGNAPGTGIDILAGIERDILGEAAQFGIAVAATPAPNTSTDVPLGGGDSLMGPLNVDSFA
jgi:hypothetical protein